MDAVIDTLRDRVAYVRAQVARSRAKFAYCKVPDVDVARYRAALGPIGPIACLGVRNGTEVARFVQVFEQPVIGVEINPQCTHPGVLIRSFDDLPAAWAGQFGLVFSNSLDHAYDVEATVRGWQRLLKPSGVLIIALNGHAQPTEADCATFTLDDLTRWLDACVLWRTDAGHYPEAWFQRWTQ